MNKHDVGRYKEIYSFEERKKEANRVINKYPDRLPIIVEYSKDFSEKHKKMYKQRYLVFKDHNIGIFINVIRKEIDLSPDKALFILVQNKTLARLGDTVGEVYDKHKDDDDILYIQIALESTFG